MTRRQYFKGVRRTSHGTPMGHTRRPVFVTEPRPVDPSWVRCPRAIGLSCREVGNAISFVTQLVRLWD